MSHSRQTSTFLATLASLLLAANVLAAGLAPQPTICDRACWVARAPSGSISQLSSLNRAVIHHTAGSADYNVSNIEESKVRVRAIQSYHMDTNGWSDIGYHFLADKLGNAFEGRQGSLTSLPRGAHDGVNTNSFGFNIMGYYHTPYNQVPTAEGKAALYGTIAWRVPDPFTGFGGSSYGISSNAGYVCGHRDAAATACPGDLMYAYIGTDNYGGEARLAINNLIVNGGGGPTPTPTATPIPGTDVIVDNDQGSPAYAETGTWATSGSTGYNGGTYRYATAGSASTATWTATLADTASYEVSVIYVAGTNRTTSTKYNVGGTSVYVNQQVNSLTWVLLGTFNLSAGDNAVVLDAAGSSGGGTVCIADAVHFLKVGDPTPTATPSPTPSPTPAPIAMHVESITMTSGKSGKNYYARASVLVKDANGAAVSGAAVSGTWSGSVSGTGSGTTGSNGTVVIQSANVKNGGTFTFCVDSVTASGRTYDPGANVETCDTITAP